MPSDTIRPESDPTTMLGTVLVCCAIILLFLFGGLLVGHVVNLWTIPQWYAQEARELVCPEDAKAACIPADYYQWLEKQARQQRLEHETIWKETAPQSQTTLQYEQDLRQREKAD